MQRSHLVFGAEGEARAARFLARRGYRILARNVRAGGVEIDLVAARGALLAFVEVKTRRTRDFGAFMQSGSPKLMAALTALKSSGTCQKTLRLSVASTCSSARCADSRLARLQTS